MYEGQLDFASSLYLGFRHDCLCLPEGIGLTTGMPSALELPGRNAAIALGIARMQGCAAGILAPSTLHLSWDLFCVFSNPGGEIYLASGAYPIIRWGAERAHAKGVMLRIFRHDDPGDLGRLLRKSKKRRPIIAADGYTLSSANAAPIRDYLAIAKEHGGLLVIDDTQAIGILGRSPSQLNPYGLGGGGSLQHAKIEGDPDIIVISSLAKGYGVPVAVLSGSPGNIKKFMALSKTMVHCSPPSNAVVVAAERALELNRRYGNALRAKLLGNVRLFKSMLSKGRFFAAGGAFPVQMLIFRQGLCAEKVYDHLLDRGIRAVLKKGRNKTGSILGFIIKASHGEAEIRRASSVLLDACKNNMQRGLLKKGAPCGRP